MSAAELVAQAGEIASRGVDQLTNAPSLDALADIERRLLGKASPLNEIREAIKTVDGPDRAQQSQAEGSRHRGVLDRSHLFARKDLVIGEVRAKVQSDNDQGASKQP